MTLVTAINSGLGLASFNTKSPSFGIFGSKLKPRVQCLLQSRFKELVNSQSRLGMPRASKQLFFESPTGVAITKNCPGMSKHVSQTTVFAMFGHALTNSATTDWAALGAEDMLAHFFLIAAEYIS